MPETDEISALKEALAREQQMRQEAEAALAEAQRARRQFVSLVTHELRVPMTSIKGYTDLLLKGIVGPISDAQRNFLQTIRTNVERMSRMVADLSDINKLEAGALQLTPTAVALNEALDEALRNLASAIEAKRQTLIREIPDTLPALWCDRARLVQVLGNLLSNAHLYTPEGGVIAVSAEYTPDEAQSVRIAVRDTGIGILPEEQGRIFEMFFRASDEETRQIVGNGLALHLSKLLIEQQGGRIWFTSERGKGSTFIVQLPTAP
ncbi:MAG TPA: HAMP domain-containing sensor histidine kinase [Anaerolineae bacterium]|nr:HAMP domain-containing sensor histidine kinase [Anaerolineae bacterium]HQK13146.1 HAMP domain-containing sensor histidine kinase [Anaerolineae bacterium]